MEGYPACVLAMTYGEGPKEGVTVFQRRSRMRDRAIHLVMMLNAHAEAQGVHIEGKMIQRMARGRITKLLYGRAFLLQLTNYSNCIQ